MCDLVLNELAVLKYTNACSELCEGDFMQVIAERIGSNFSISIRN